MLRFLIVTVVRLFEGPSHVRVEVRRAQRNIEQLDTLLAEPGTCLLYLGEVLQQRVIGIVSPTPGVWSVVGIRLANARLCISQIGHRIEGVYAHAQPQLATVRSAKLTQDVSDEPR